MNRRRYLAAVGATLLAGCASPDGTPQGTATTEGPPTLSFGEPYLLSTGVELACDGVETADSFDMDGESVSAPDDRTWALASLRAENRAEESRTLPARQGISVRYGEQSFQHDVNHAPAEFLFWEGGYTGGEAVDPAVSAEGVVPVPVDPAAVDGDPTVVYRPTVTDADSEVWWTAG